MQSRRSFVSSLAVASALLVAGTGPALATQA